MKIYVSNGACTTHINEGDQLVSSDGDHSHDDEDKLSRLDVSCGTSRNPDTWPLGNSASLQMLSVSSSSSDKSSTTGGGNATLSNTPIPLCHSPRNLSNISEASCTVMTLTFSSQPTGMWTVEPSKFGRLLLWDLSRFRLRLRAKCSSVSGSATLLTRHGGCRALTNLSIHIIQCYEYAVRGGYTIGDTLTAHSILQE